ncbi:MAG: hypothetical protein DI598_04380 [Pseudopedobacter saltans]|uniref:Major royal jelly protein n=1 Tax=Pseudopedobacter saltans TaxID=151895 RepID=A0A2W5F9R6_9SPHI|nr:MAG: hypothetical protein DI598_04380 [Pseudopedobacter saltans]
MKSITILFLCIVSFTLRTHAQMPKEYPVGINLAASLDSVEPAGVVVTEDNRLFVALPRGGVNHHFPSVAEIVNDKIIPFPNQSINENVNTDYAHHLVSVLGITLYKNTLWILDQGKRAGIDHIPDGATKVVAVDILSKKILKTIPIPKPFFRETIQLNDLRFDPTHGKEGTIYISNNGFAKPDQSIIVVDVATGRLRELFRDAPEVSPVKGFMTYIEGLPHVLSYSHPTMPQGGVNGIELTHDFKKLYWTIPTNPNFYSISTDTISNFALSDDAVKKAIHWEGQIVSNGGITIDKQDNLYFGDASRYSILKRTPNGKVSLVAYDPRLIWPDGLFVQNDSLYVTIGQWHRSPGLNGGKDLRHGPYDILKIPLSEAK